MGDYALVADPVDARGARTAAFFREAGLPVFRVRDGREAWGVVGEHGAPTVLVTELSLPRIDGFALTRHLRSMPAGGGTRVVVLSAFREMREQASALRDELEIDEILGIEISEEALQRVLTHRALSWRGTVTPRPCSLAPARKRVLDEASRLRSLAQTGVRERSSADAKLDVLVKKVADRFEVPTALVSLVFDEQQWFKARVGLDVESTPLDVSFCRHVVGAQETLVVPDATEHPVFKENDLVTGGVVRGYAGAPLIGSDGATWGALCIIDAKNPLRVNARDLEDLDALAREVVREIEASRPASLSPSR